MTKQTSANNNLIAAVKAQYNQKIFKRFAELVNSDGEAAAIEYMDQFSRLAVTRKVLLGEAKTDWCEHCGGLVYNDICIDDNGTDEFEDDEVAEIKTIQARAAGGRAQQDRLDEAEAKATNPALAIEPSTETEPTQQDLTNLEIIEFVLWAQTHSDIFDPIMIAENDPLDAAMLNDLVHEWRATRDAKHQGPNA